MCHTFPHIPADTLDRLAEAVGQKGQKKAMVAAIGMVLQTVVRFSLWPPCAKYTVSSPIFCW